ncbi:MAG: PHB depolymerase family esterase [Xanthobacteraceae bacterium]
MPDFDAAMGKLRTLRGKFEQLLESAREKVAGELKAPGPRSARLQEVAAFGANPGNLRMFAYSPEQLSAGAPLVVALHGCGQTAAEFDYGSGWSELADRFGFAVLYPEQQPANNPKTCFSWFLAGDIARDCGEALSIRQMIAHALITFDLDEREVFVAGLSAGGAMASVMLATYPEVFAGGAIIAGLPYGCAANAQQAFDAMFGDKTYSATVLGDRVRAASRHRGSWPKISVWHGSADPIVKPVNAENIVRQWSDVHGLSELPSYETTIERHQRRVWTDTDGEPLIEAISVRGMGHGVPLAATGEKSCGAAGAFFLDAGISSTYHIAQFWRLDERGAERSRAPARLPRPIQGSADADLTMEDIAEPNSGSEISVVANARSGADTMFDPNRIIAAAFAAAGLPMLDTPPDATSRVAPGPIIEAALKAAGLKRR